MRIVLLPQAFRTMLPAIISQLVVVLKDTSLITFVANYDELLSQGESIQRNLDNPIQTFFVDRADLHRHELLPWGGWPSTSSAGRPARAGLRRSRRPRPPV